MYMWGDEGKAIYTDHLVPVKERHPIQDDQKRLWTVIRFWPNENASKRWIKKNIPRFILVGLIIYHYFNLGQKCWFIKKMKSMEHGLLYRVTKQIIVQWRAFLDLSQFCGTRKDLTTQFGIKWFTTKFIVKSLLTC